MVTLALPVFPFTVALTLGLGFTNGADNVRGTRRAVLALPSGATAVFAYDTGSAQPAVRLSLDPDAAARAEMATVLAALGLSPEQIAAALAEMQAGHAAPRSLSVPVAAPSLAPVRRAA